MSREERIRALLLTVGTGDVEKAEETLLAPLRKSISQGEWNRVVLLPSQLTRPAADLLRNALDGLPVEVCPLPEVNRENDADACYAHFNEVISGLRAAGFDNTNIVVDFTRGTKAMSAALVLAAVRHEIPRLRYITGERDQRGMVRPGTEVVSEVRTTMVTCGKLADTARAFMLRGQFAAVLDLLPDPNGQFAVLWPGEFLQTVAHVRAMAEFCAAWDRLDYASASRVELPDEPSPQAEWRPLVPTARMRQWVSDLAAPTRQGSSPETCTGNAQRLRLLAVDLLANGERRIRDKQYEDAILRAYRVLELVGQTRLFDRGLDSAHLPPDNEHVRNLDNDLKRNKENGFGRNRDGTWNAGRELAARLLKRMGDTLAPKLLELGRSAFQNASARNKSILIHGFEAGKPDEAALGKHYADLEALLVKDSGADATQRLAVARSLDLSRM